MHNMPEHFGPEQFRDIDAELWVERKSEDEPDDPYMLQKAIDGVLNVGRDNTRLPMEDHDQVSQATRGAFRAWQVRGLRQRQREDVHVLERSVEWLQGARRVKFLH